MSKSIEDFKIGDRVYHLSNTKLTMVVIKIDNKMNEVVCRWIDNEGQLQMVEFMPEELGDASDLGPKILYF